MKHFFIWLGVFLALFAGLGLGYHFYLSASGARVFVAVDVSLSLDQAKPKLKALLVELGGRPYTRYMVVTNSSSRAQRLVQAWQAGITPDTVRKLMEIAMFDTLPLAPLREFSEKDEADEVLFLTNAADTSALSGVARSRVVRVD
jgi:lipase chaperone LimK